MIKPKDIAPWVFFIKRSPPTIVDGFGARDGTRLRFCHKGRNKGVAAV